MAKSGKSKTATRRRTKGEGSWTTLPSGLLRLKVGVGHGKYRYFYGRSKAEINRKRADTIARQGGTLGPRVSGTVGEWVERWLRDDVKPNRSPNTYALYETMWRMHAARVIGNVALEVFDVPDVERLYRTLRENGVSSAVMQRVAVVLSRAFEVGIRRRAYSRANPFRLVEKPAHRAKESRALSADEARSFVLAAREDRFFALWLLLLSSGLRLGEALALKWSDVDLDDGIVMVTKSLVEVGGACSLTETKTRSSRRRVEIGAAVVTALREHRKAPPADSVFVFTNSAGGHPRRSNLRQRHFEPICERAGLEGLTIHGLRHSMTSLALAAGVQPKVVAERLGHSTTRLTLDRYGHVLPGLQRAAADEIDAILGASSRPERPSTRKG